jgi:DNA-binding CsgD family transcriptional regulator
LWALLRAMQGDDEAPGDAVVDAMAVVPVHAAMRDLARAVVEARHGRPERASALAAHAEQVLVAGRMFGPMHLARRHLAEAALADGWGEPVRWLTEALHFFDPRGDAELASACRSLLRGAGQRVPRPSAAGAVPDGLRPLGVTVREAEVLRLVGERLTNAEIADRLHLSARTVEKHVEHLLRKTGVPSRRALAGVARQHAAGEVPPTTHAPAGDARR